MSLVTPERVAAPGNDESQATKDEHAIDLAALVEFIKKRARGSFTMKVAGAGLGFVVHLTIARSIGVSEYGIYALMLSWISVLAVVAQFGQDSGVLRFLPAYAVRESWGLIKGLRRGSSLLVLGFSLLISCGGLAYVHWHLSNQSLPLIRTFDVGFLLLPVLALLQQSGALHRALKHAAESDFYVLIVRPLALVLLVASLHFLAPSLLSAPLVAALSLVSAVVALAWSDLRLRIHWPVRAHTAQPEYQMGAWVKVGAQLSLLSVMMVTSTTMGSLVIGAFLGAKRVGPYYAAVQLAGFASFGFTAINTILAPMIAEYHAAGRHKLLAELMRTAARITFLSTTVLSLGLAVFGRHLLTLFGPGFAVAYAPLLILLLGEWLNTCAGSVGYLLIMTRFQKQAPVIFLCGVVSSLFLAILIVPVWGLTGMALSTVVGWVVWNIVALTYVYKKLRINPTVFQWRRSA
ncbi:MAG: oligosaccharide flippase family protein [Steroidobacteraceae bacterium]